MAALSAISAHMESATLGSFDPTRFNEEFVRRASELHGDVHKSWQDVALIGPAEVVPAAKAAWRSSFAVSYLSGDLSMANSDPPPKQPVMSYPETYAIIREGCEDLIENMEHFITEARHALDDDGTSRGGHRRLTTDVAP